MNSSLLHDAIVAASTALGNHLVPENVLKGMFGPRNAGNKKIVATEVVPFRNIVP